MQDTSISWTDWTWNPIRGCSRISPGCQHCYAERDMARKNTNPKVPGCHGFAEFRMIGGRREAHWTGKVELIEGKLLEPLSWRSKARRFATEHGRKPRTFISMSDLFHERLSDESIDRVFAVATLCPEINFLFLTKRAERMERYFNGPDLYNRRLVAANHVRAAFADACNVGISDPVCFPPKWIWLGVSVEDQKRADERIPHLLRTPAAVRFLSVEPMLSEIATIIPYQFAAGGEVVPLDSLRGYTTPADETRKVDWVICGGESGHGARPFDLAWARSLRDQCRSAGTAFWMKQLGSNARSTVIGERFNGPFAPRIKARNGDDPAEWPEDLRIQEMPR